MQPYLNHNGRSGVIAYQIGGNYIDVQFHDGSVYRYTYSSTGFNEVEEMKTLAVSGKGLTTFINKYVRENFGVKLR